MDFDAIVLAGGTGRRMGGADKAALEVAGRTLLEAALDATSAAGRTVVVGPERATARSVVWCREEPRGAGPAAALAEGLNHVEAPIVAVLAVDYPRLTSAIVARLVSSVGADGAMATDASGRAQPLLAAYDAEALRRAVREIPALEGASVRSLVAGLAIEEVPLGEAAADVDTFEDLRRLDGEGA